MTDTRKLCKFDVFTTQCEAVVAWRVRVANAGPTMSHDEAYALFDEAPECIYRHGRKSDHDDLQMLLAASLVGVAMHETD